MKDAAGRFNQLVLPLSNTAKINPIAADALDQYDLALKRLPTGEALARALDEARSELERAVQHTRTERSLSFGRIEAGFVRAAREAGAGTREISNGWRIGRLALELRRPQARARVLYNHEVLVDWKPIRSVEDLQRLQQAADKLLTGTELPAEMLANVYWDAYVQLRDRQARPGKARPESVAILDLYGEVRSTLVRYELEGQKPDRKLKYAEFPRWAFLYNLDRLRALGADMPAGRRLSLATGSQQEATRIGVSVNGLDAGDDYKTMCYVQAQPGAGG